MSFNSKLRSRALLAALALGSSVAATAAQPAAIEIGQATSLWSEVLDEPRPLQIHLPASYEQSRARYPVLYLLDGDRNFLHAVGAIEFLAEGGRIPEHIVVSIPNVDRARDLTPCADGTDRCGGADKFLRFLQQDLFPWVEGKYRTERFRTIVGHSMGGQFAFHTLLNQPAAFNAYIAISPALWVNDAAIFNKAEGKLAALPPQRFLYFSDGNESSDITNNVTKMAALMKKQRPAGLSWSSEHFADDQHATTPHKSLYNGLERIFSGVQVDRAVILSQGLKGVDAHYATLEARYGFKLQPPKGMLEWMGYFCLQQKRPAAAVEFFQRNVERFPNDASAYEALASGLEAAGRHEEAKAAFIKAYQRAVKW
jgi:predicted alpha/beta superfamily hydrolase